MATKCRWLFVGGIVAALFVGCRREPTQIGLLSHFYDITDPNDITQEESEWIEGKTDKEILVLLRNTACTSTYHDLKEIMGLYDLSKVLSKKDKIYLYRILVKEKCYEPEKNWNYRIRLK